MRKYFVLMPTVNNCAKVLEFYDYKDMIECIRKHHQDHERLPDLVIYGVKMEFEPAEIVKSWKVKETR